MLASREGVGPVGGSRGVPKPFCCQVRAGTMLPSEARRLLLHPARKFRMRNPPSRDITRARRAPGAFVLVDPDGFAARFAWSPRVDARRPRYGTGWRRRLRGDDEPLPRDC